MLSAAAAVDQAKKLYEIHVSERRMLDEVRRYWRGRQKLPAMIPTASPREVKVMARSSRVNVMPIVVNSLVQSMFVDGFRGSDDEMSPVWDIWLANRMNKRQTGIHRAAAAYGTAYAVVLPGDPVPTIRPVSPRMMTAVYGEDPDWPMWALEQLDRKSWRLYDEEAIYFLSGGGEGKWEFIESRLHDAPGVTPVVRFQDEVDLDVDDEATDESQTLGQADRLVIGQVAPLMELQDQIDLTTFGLQIAQHYGAFRQRYVIGWVAENEAEQLKASAATLWTLDADPSQVQMGEFSQSDLRGYIESRESSLRHAAALSQTPVHELTATLIQMSAEALAAAEAGKDRKVDERCTLAGESHQQTLWLAGHYQGIEVPEDAQVVWRDTSARAFAATVDGLGKLVQMLGIPPQELWERVPGATQQDVERWKATASQGDAFANLAAMLDRQAADELPV